MKICIAAVGKAKAASPQRQLAQEYARRLPWKVEYKECNDEAALLAACKPYDRRIALDEGGRQFTSQAFAGQIEAWRQQGFSSLAFAIGGADGHTPAFLKHADLLWSLGQLTWPHRLVPALVAEQLYRAWSIINRHPYHRE